MSVLHQESYTPDCIHTGLSLSPLLQDGYTPLMLAAYNGQEDTVKELLSSGASIISTNKVSTDTLYGTCT